MGQGGLSLVTLSLPTPHLTPAPHQLGRVIPPQPHAQERRGTAISGCSPQLHSSPQTVHRNKRISVLAGSGDSTAAVGSLFRDQAEEVMRVLRCRRAQHIWRAGGGCLQAPIPPGTSQPSPEECSSTAAAAGRGGACQAPWHEGMIGHAPPDREYLSQTLRGTQGVYGWRRSSHLVKPGRWCSTERGGCFQLALPLPLVNGKLPLGSNPLPHHTPHVAHGSCGGKEGGRMPFSPWHRGYKGSGLRRGVGWVVLLGPSSLNIAA